MSDRCNETIEPFQRPPGEEDEKTFRVPYVTVICVMKLSVDSCTIKRRSTSHSFHFRTYV